MAMFEDDEVVVWDTEFTSWPGCHENGWDKSEGEYKEIIQIGAVKIDTEDMEIVDSFNRFVKPQINSELSEYIKNLTGITQKQVNEANRLEVVLNNFINWFDDCKLYSVGNDWNVVEKNLDLYEKNFEVSERVFKDIRPIFKQRGVPIDDWASGSVANYLEPELELLPQHNALNDSKNMAKALKILNH